jgi:hypothetical protein
VVITIVVPDGGVAAVGERAGAPVAYARGVVRIPAKYPCRDPEQISSIATDLSSERKPK